MANPTIRFKRGTQSAFSAVGLNTGEPAFITDESNFYIGVDGNSANNKFFGSSRYWKKETTTSGGGVNLFGSHAVGVSGTSITLASPTSVGTAITYTFPATVTAGYQLITDSNGNLSWSNTSPSGGFSGITTFTDSTNNTLGSTNTGSLQIQGGAAITKNLTVGSGLSVTGNAWITGVSTFVGNVTFQGGTINLGDSNTDDIVVAGEFASNLIPTTNNSYDLGNGTQSWRNGSFSGIVTATTFVGNLTGTATTATTVATNSVGLGTHTYGDYVKSISGTSNQITVSAASGEGSTPTLSIPNQFTIPQDATVIRDLQVNRNLNVTGNVTIGGTSVSIFAQELKISDPDIVLGFRTDAFGNDISNDTTSNHGGVALASTEGTPLVNLFIAGIETNPSTYKKIMWFKEGTFAGLGTDAWLFNYAVGIGSTQFPSGTRLAAGSVQFTQNDLAVVRNINASGVITATTFSGNVSSATYATSSGISTYATSSGISTYAITSGVSTSVIGGIGSITQLNVSGVSTFASTINHNAATFTTNQTTYNLVNTTATTLNFAGAATAIGIGAATGTATINNATVTLANATSVNVNGASPSFVSSSTGTLSLFNTNLTTVNAFGAATAIGIGAATGTATINNATVTLANATSVNVNGANPTLASSSTGTLNLFNTNITSVNAFGAATALTIGAVTGTATIRNPTTVFSGDIRVNGNDILDSGGTAAITFDGSGNTTVTGNLNVNGSTTQINTTTLTIEDQLIELGRVDGAAPVSDSNKDLGMLLHYYDTAARLGAVYWDDSVNRLVLAQRVTESTGVLTVDSGYYADVEFKGLYITDTAGTADAVISYATIGGVTTRHLQNITVDGGTF